jgi:hypothetical protein
VQCDIRRKTEEETGSQTQDVCIETRNVGSECDIIVACRIY